MNMVDDATGNTMALMAPAETTEIAMTLLSRWIETYGIPQALYTDKKNVFVTDREPTLEEQLAGKAPLTAFGKACNKLATEIITANSPQAKGRVERKHGVYQDRLVKELALRRITTIDTANKLLCNGFTDTLNAKFAHPPANEIDFHRTVPQDLNLADVFCFEYTRNVQNDWTIRFDNHHYQIVKQNRPLPRPKEKVIVRIRLDGTMHLLYRDKPLAYSRIAPPRRNTRPATTPKPACPKAPPGPHPKPAPNHPWRQGCTFMLADTRGTK